HRQELFRFLLCAESALDVAPEPVELLLCTARHSFVIRPPPGPWLGSKGALAPYAPVGRYPGECLERGRYPGEFPGGGRQPGERGPATVRLPLRVELIAGH